MSVKGASLPFELQEDIIGHLWNDSKALAACSLVSSQWSEPARILLFSNVEVGIYGELNFLDDETVGGFMTFMELLQAPHSRLGHYIQRIYIQGENCFETMNGQAASPERYSYLISVLRTILPHLNRVSEIRLAMVIWNTIPQDLKIRLGLFSKVVSLSWLRVYFDRLDQLILFSAENFPKLETLRIEELVVQATPQIERFMFAQYPNRFASLRALSLFVEESTVPFLFALSSNAVIPLQNIDTLDFEVEGWAYLGYIDSVLRATGPTLSVLKLQINNIYEPFLDSPDFELIPSLRAMKNLKSLHFPRAPTTHDLLWIKNILRTMSSAIRKLEEIHVSFAHSDFDFPALERASLEQKAPNMKVFMEPVKWARKKSQLLATLKQSLPELSKRGQVHFLGWE